MDRDNQQPNDNSSDNGLARGTFRLFFADHLRAALVILVVLHHVALVYGASVQGFYYIEPPFDDALSFLVLLVFVLFNQAWFMGAFFLLAGYFSPGSFDRKGAATFIRDRLIRLCIPLIVFVFVLNPVSRIGWWLMPGSLTGITAPLTWRAYPHLLGLGPMWFVLMLLIFSFGYAFWRMLMKGRPSSSIGSSSTPGYLGSGIFIVALAMVSYLLRIVVPIGQSVFEFPTLAYLPQYLSFFILGVIAFRRNWLQALPGALGIAGFILALVAGVLLFPLAFSGRVFSLEFGPAFGKAMGNGAWQSAIYVLWDSCTAVGLFLTFFTLFRRFFNSQGRFGKFLSQHSYGVFVLHIPIVVLVAYMLRGVKIAPLLKFSLTAAVVVPTCFLIAYVVRKVPGVSRVL